MDRSFHDPVEEILSQLTGSDLPFDPVTALSLASAGISDAVTIYDREMRHLFVNKAVENFTQVPAEQMIGRTIEDLIAAGHPHYRDNQERLRLFAGIFHRTWNGERLRDDETTMMTEGGVRCYSWILEPVYKDGEIVGAVHITRDTTNLSNATFQTAPVGMARMVGSGIILEINRTLQKMLGLPDGVTFERPLRDLLPVDRREEFDALHQDLVAGNVSQIQMEQLLMSEDGAWIPCNLTLTMAQKAPSVTRIIAVIEDIRDRKRLEVELRHAQKLESVGKLAAGMAHEINTPLQSVTANLHFAKDGVVAFGQILTAYREVVAAAGIEAAHLRALENQLDIDFLLSELPVTTDDTLGGVTRVAEIVKALQAFGQPEVSTPVSADVNELLHTTLTVATNELDGIHLEEKFTRVPKVLCLVSEMNEVFLHVIVNAVHAIADAGRKEDGTGRVEVCTESADEGILISIADNGCGIDESIAQQVFDPFFTTKEVGRGSGQGLYVCRSAVTRANGRIWFESPGEGTVFRIWLPAPTPATPTPATPTPATPTKASSVAE